MRNWTFENLSIKTAVGNFLKYGGAFCSDFADECAGCVGVQIQNIRITGVCVDDFAEVRDFVFEYVFEHIFLNAVHFMPCNNKNVFLL